MSAMTGGGSGHRRTRTLSAVGDRCCFVLQAVARAHLDDRHARRRRAHGASSASARARGAPARRPRSATAATSPSRGAPHCQFHLHRLEDDHWVTSGDLVPGPAAMATTVAGIGAVMSWSAAALAGGRAPSVDHLQVPGPAGGEDPRRGGAAGERDDRSRPSSPVTTTRPPSMRSTRTARPSTRNSPVGEHLDDMGCVAIAYLVASAHPRHPRIVSNGSKLVGSRGSPPADGPVTPAPVDAQPRGGGQRCRRRRRMVRSGGPVRDRDSRCRCRPAMKAASPISVARNDRLVATPRISKSRQRLAGPGDRLVAA